MFNAPSALLLARVVSGARVRARPARDAATPKRASARRRRCADVRLLGADTEVLCADGRSRRYVNLDYAASTPALPEVWQAVEAFMPWYSSVHRGSGMKSQVATEAFEGTRAVVADFVGAPCDAEVIFVRNTTEAINVLAAALPPGARVLSSPVEHHANMLPWRRHDLQVLPFPESADALCAACERALSSARPSIDLVAVTGASNVTGEVWPLARLAEIVHRHGAQLFVDGAQLVPHRPIDMSAAGIDFLALSGHKLYAPFGAGALVGPAGRLGDAGAAAARRWRGQAGDARSRHLGGRAGAARGRFAQRRRSRRARRRLPRAGRARHGGRRGARAGARRTAAARIGRGSGSRAARALER